MINYEDNQCKSSLYYILLYFFYLLSLLGLQQLIKQVLKSNSKKLMPSGSQDISLKVSCSNHIFLVFGLDIVEVNQMIS
jgi:hypothetical protein